MLKRMLRMLRKSEGVALISVILLFVVLSIIGISLTGVAVYSHKTSVGNWQYEQAQYIARSSAISIRDYAKSIINKISELDVQIAAVEFQIAEAVEDGQNVDALVAQRESLIDQSDAEKQKIESILSSGINVIKATGKILSTTDDDFEATIEELEPGADEYSARKYKVRSIGKFQGVEAVSTVYINYQPIDDYLPYLGPTPNPGFNMGGLMDSFVFYSSVKNIMTSKVEGDVNVLGDASMVSAVNNEIYGNMYVGGLGNGQDNSVYAQKIEGDLISPSDITVYASNVEGAIIVDGSLKLGLNNGDSGHSISEYVSASGDVYLENGVRVPIVYTKGNLYLGNGSTDAYIEGELQPDGTIVAAKVEKGIYITNSGCSGDLLCNEDVVFTRGEVNGNISTCGKAFINVQSTILKNLIANSGISTSQATIGGSVYSEGDVSLYNTTVGENVFTYGDLILGGTTVLGNVITEGNITVQSDNWGGGYKNLISHKDVTIEHGGFTVTENIIAGGNVTINPASGSCTIIGDIIANGDITIVNGDIQGRIISMNGTVNDLRGNAAPPCTDEIVVTIPEVPMVKAEKLEVELPRIEDTTLTLTKFDTFTIPENIKSSDADTYKEDVKTIVINSSGKINTGWFEVWNSSNSLLGRNGSNPWDPPYEDQTLIIDASDENIDLYLDGDLKFQRHCIKRILIRGHNIVRLFMEKGSSFIMDNVTIAAEANQYAVSNDGLIPPNFYIMASSATMESDIPKISFGDTDGINTFEGYIISPSSDITVINTRVLGAIVSNNLTELRGSDMAFYPANKLTEAMEGLNYTFKMITVDRDGIREQTILNPQT